MTDAPTPSELREIARHWIEEGWRNGDPDMVDRLHAPRFVDHDPAGRDPGREGFKDGIRELYAAFPDLEARVEDLVIDPSTASVAVRWSARGTHRGRFMGFGATDRVVRFKGIEIIRIANGCITERWGEWDGLDLLSQLAGPRA